jgi:hypothetical protein
VSKYIGAAVTSALPFAIHRCNVNENSELLSKKHDITPDKI